MNFRRSKSIWSNPCKVFLTFSKGIPGRICYRICCRNLQEFLEQFWIYGFLKESLKDFREKSVEDFLKVIPRGSHVAFFGAIRRKIFKGILREFLEESPDKGTYDGISK